MELLAQYSDSPPASPSVSGGPQTSASLELIDLPKVNLAPQVAKKITPIYEGLSSTVGYNPTYESMWAPMQGPMHPVYSKPKIAEGQLNSLNGFVEDAFVNQFDFDNQYHNFNNRGYAQDPVNGSQIVDATATIQEVGKKPAKRKRLKFGDPATDEFRGPWAPFEDEERIRKEFQEAADSSTKQTQAEMKKVEEEAKRETTTTEEEDDLSRSDEVDDDRRRRRGEPVEPKSIFHGTELRDYLGRSYVDPPSHLKPHEHECWLPKKLIHTWTGHTKGVNVIQLAPKYGHILLSGSTDCKLKIWDVYNKQRCLRTFMGHTKAVRDVNWTRDARRFISAAYDRNVLLWDSETGQLLGQYSNGKIPYCVRFHPDHDRQHIFLAGCADKRIVQWDTRSGKIVQTYDQHLGAINTITFLDQGRRFVSSSDDKSLRVWEFGIPVVIKYISEPHMHAMPSIAMHPDGNWFAAQSMDSQVMVYSTKERFRLNKKKVFKGHDVSGYACQLDFSPDGHWLVSADADGRLFFWDWNTCRLVKSFKAHEGVGIGVQWHQIEPSRVISCGWDGAIKYWD